MNHRKKNWSPTYSFLILLLPTFRSFTSD